jgi:hypothetical protein
MLDLILLIGADVKASRAGTGRPRVHRGLLRMREAAPLGVAGRMPRMPGSKRLLQKTPYRFRPCWKVRFIAAKTLYRGPKITLQSDLNSRIGTDGCWFLHLCDLLKP